MKLYVVTEGCYSDYGIVCIFLDKDKADNYVKYNQGSWDDMRIEEYETSDEGYKIISDGFYQVSGEITITKNCTVTDSSIYDKILTCTPEEDETSLIDYSLKHKENWHLYIQRSFPEKSCASEDNAVKKLTHILKDTASMVADFRQQGYSFEDVKKMLGIKEENIYN